MYDAIQPYIAASRRALLIGHVSPDGDSIGSLLGLKWILEGLNKEVIVASQDGVPASLRWLPGWDTVVVEVAGKGVDLVITLDSSDMERLGTVYQPSHFVCCPHEWTPVTPRHPLLLITPEVAETLVAGSGTTLEALEDEAAQLDKLGVLERPLGKTAVLEVPGKVYEVQARNVLAYIPGGTGTGGSAGEVREAVQKMDDQMLVLMTPYDGVGLGPEGVLFPGAQQGGAGVATMLELARSWTEADYRPKRAVLFVAYVDQGVPPDRTFEQRPDPKSFLQAKRGFSAYKIWSIFELGHLGAADGDRLVVDTASTRLGRLIVQSARRVGVRVRRVESVVDLEAVQERGTVGMGEGEDFVQVWVYWEGGTPSWGSADDGPEHVSAESLERAGRALSLALMVLGREWNY